MCVCARVFFVSLFVCLLVDLIDCLLVCVCVVYTCLWLRSRLPVFECMDPSVTRSLRNLHGFARHLATSEEVLRGFHNSKGFDPEVLFRSREGILMKGLRLHRWWLQALQDIQSSQWRNYGPA